MRLALALALIVLAPGCCCFGAMPPPPATSADDPAIVREARAYLEAHARELLEPAAAREDGGGRCAAAIAELALAVGVPIVTRGHAGFDVGAEASYDVAACAARVRIVLQRIAATGAWIVVGAETLVAGAVVASLGSPTVITRDDDVDVDIDELFD